MQILFISFKSESQPVVLRIFHMLRVKYTNYDLHSVVHRTPHTNTKRTYRHEL